MNKWLVWMLCMFCCLNAQAAVIKTPAESGIELKPGESRMVTIASTQALEVGCLAVQERKCTMHCVEAVDRSGGYEYMIATDLGASMKYTPTDGKIMIEYRNKADHPVVIDVYTVQRVCDAEACAFLQDSDQGNWLVYKIAEFKAIETSKDNSYSVISGVTTNGKEFTVKAVWWTDDNSFPFSCYSYIEKYLTDKTPPVDYAPYILSGKTSGNDPTILKSIDTCVPKAPNFGVPEENVF